MIWLALGIFLYVCVGAWVAVIEDDGKFAVDFSLKRFFRLLTVTSIWPLVLLYMVYVYWKEK